MAETALDRAYALAGALHAAVLDARIVLAQERDGMLTYDEMIAKLGVEEPDLYETEDGAK